MRKIDKLNNGFLNIIERDTAPTRRINRAIIDGEDDIKKLVEEDQNNKRDATFYYMIAVLSIIMSRSLSRKEKTSYAPIIILTKMYSTKNPELFAKKMNKIFVGRGLSGREKTAKNVLNRFIKQGKKVIDKIQRKIIDIRIKARSEIFKDVERLKGSTYKETKKELLKKYNSKSRVTRALRTEAHAELERGKLIQADEFGYTHKIWKTRNDSRVRKTAWHNAVTDKRVPIDSEFRAVGMRAQYPGDVRLPVGERIYCRCFLIME